MWRAYDGQCTKNNHLATRPPTHRLPATHFLALWLAVRLDVSITSTLAHFRSVCTSICFLYPCFRVSIEGGNVPKLTFLTPWPESASELCRSSDNRLSANLVPTFTGRSCHVVSVTDPYGCILGFLGRNRYSFFKVAPQF
jgi:hypothetical protein